MTKDDYQKYAADAINDIKNRLEELYHRSGRMNEPAKTDYLLKLKDLNQHRLELEQKLQELIDTPESRWEAIKEELGQRILRIKEGFKKVFVNE